MPRPEPVREPSPPPGPKDEDFFDATMAVRSGPGRSRSRGGAFLAPGRGRGRKGALEFVEEGSLQRQAEIMRLKQKYGETMGFFRGAVYTGLVVHKLLIGSVTGAVEVDRWYAHVCVFL